MKGKKGGESPAMGVAYPTSAVPVTSKANILAAAKKRKRGGAVASMKVMGDAPKERLDKPKRARGGATQDRSALKSIRDNMEVNGQKVYATGPNPKKDEVKRATRSAIDSMKNKMQFASGGSVMGMDKNDPRRADGGMVKNAERAAGNMLSAAQNAPNAASMPMRTTGSKTGPALKSKALRGDHSKPVERARGGKVGADDAPYTHATCKTATRGHFTQPNIT